MAHMYRHDAKKSHVDKIARMCGGYTKKAHGGASHKMPKIAHRKKGGKVMKADGGAAAERLDRRPRMPIPMPRPRPEGVRPQPTDLYTPEQIRRIEAQRAKGGHVDAADLAAQNVTFGGFITSGADSLLTWPDGAERAEITYRYADGTGADRDPLRHAVCRPSRAGEHRSSRRGRVLAGRRRPDRGRVWRSARRR